MRARTRWFLLDKHLDIIAISVLRTSRRNGNLHILFSRSSCSGGLRRLCQAHWRQMLGCTLCARPALSTISNTAGRDIALILRSAPPSSSPGIGGTVGDPSPCDDESGTSCLHREGVISCHSRRGQNSSTLLSRGRKSLFMTDGCARHGSLDCTPCLQTLDYPPTHPPACAIRPRPPGRHVYSVAWRVDRSWIARGSQLLQGTCNPTTRAKLTIMFSPWH